MRRAYPHKPSLHPLQTLCIGTLISSSMCATCTETCTNGLRGVRVLLFCLQSRGYLALQLSALSEHALTVNRSPGYNTHPVSFCEKSNVSTHANPHATSDDQNLHYNCVQVLEKETEADDGGGGGGACHHKQYPAVHCLDSTARAVTL